MNAVRRILSGTCAVVMLFVSVTGAYADNTPGRPAPVHASPSARPGDPLLPFISDSGLISLSVAAFGGNDPSGGTISVHKNVAGATVREAFLFAASTGGTGYTPVNGDITLNGTPVTLTPPTRSRMTSPP